MIRFCSFHRLELKSAIFFLNNYIEVTCLAVLNLVIWSINRKHTVDSYIKMILPAAKP
jgi:hypothetical protein